MKLWLFIIFGILAYRSYTQIEVLSDNSVGIGTSNTHGSKLEVYGGANDFKITAVQTTASQTIGLQIVQNKNISLVKKGLKISTKGLGSTLYVGTDNYLEQPSGSSSRSNGIFNRVLLKGQTTLGNNGNPTLPYAAGIYNNVTSKSGSSGPKAGIYTSISSEEANPLYGIYSYVTQTSAGNKYAVFANSSHIALYGYSSGHAGYFQGNVTVTGTFTQGSDQKLKTDIQDLDSEKVKTKFKKLKAKQYKLKADKEKRTKYGFVAQDIQTIFPEMVYESATADIPMKTSPKVRQLKTRKSD